MVATFNTEEEAKKFCADLDKKLGYPNEFAERYAIPEYSKKADKWWIQVEDQVKDKFGKCTLVKYDDVKDPIPEEDKQYI